MIGINLLPDLKKEFIKAQRTRNTVISLSILAMIFVAGLTALLALIVYVWQGTMIGMIKSDITKKQSSLAAKPEIEKYLTIQNQLDGLKSLHDDKHKIVYSRLLDFFPLLNPAAPNNVGISSVKIKQDDTSINLQGSTANFQGVTTFKNTLENAKVMYKVKGEQKETNLFTDVTLKSASLGQSNGKSTAAFEFIVKYSPEVFSPDVTEIQLNVPKLTISDSQTNAPNELFKDTGEGAK